MRVYSVSEFVQSFNALIEATVPSAAVSGEVSGFRETQGRMIYFDLKDEKSKILCFALKWEIPQGIHDGMHINVVGSPRLFVGSGKFHLRVREVEFRGEGVLQKLYRELLGRLEKEGLFSESRKKPLPRYPETIGLITSEDAAAYTDVMKILREKIACQVWFYPVKVQGLGSESSVVRALEYFNKYQPVDVLMLVRGGGSLEDLQTFNSERVARAIASSRIPVIVGVGHERDVTIADLVADRRASTPTNAAEIVLPSRKEMRAFVEGRMQSLSREVVKSVGERRFFLGHAVRVLELARDRVFDSARNLIRSAGRCSFHTEHACSRFTQVVNQKLTALFTRMTYVTQSLRHRIELFGSTLSSFDPREVLKRGYTLTLKNQKIMKSRNQIKRGDVIETRFADGSVHSVASDRTLF